MKTRIIEKQIRKFLISPSAKPIDYVAENDWIDDDYDNDDEYPSNNYYVAVHNK